MNQILRQPDEQQLTAVNQIVQDFLRIHPSIQSITVSSVDGRSLAHATRNHLSADQLSAIASSTFSLCLALQRELITGDYQQMALDGSQGRIIMLGLGGSPSLVLTVVCRHNHALGHDLWVAHQLCSCLELALST